MQFGKVTQPELINFALPKDHPYTRNVFNKTYINNTQFSIGCAKWNKQDLKNFYPRGTKDELSYYSKQFNSIELNATFYQLYSKEQFKKWFQKTPDNFLFYPKIPREISHDHQLKSSAQASTQNFINNSSHLQHKLGSVFLQLHENFSPQQFSDLKSFVSSWPTTIPLAIELRHTDWFQNKTMANKLYTLYQQYNISNIITDTAGRRDLLHMCLTNSKVFIRFVGANHPSDFQRLDEWVHRIDNWTKNGLQSVSFFIHQNVEIESVLLSSYFVKQLNKQLNINLKVPVTLSDLQSKQTSLFDF